MNLSTIQKRNKLNTVSVVDEPNPINKGHHHYRVGWRTIEGSGMVDTSISIVFQNGPRSDPDSIHGVLDTDLLEIVRHRLQSFQSGPYATRENAVALTHIEEALLWMNKRVEDRAEAGILGTSKV